MAVILMCNFKHILVTVILSIFCETALTWVPQDVTVAKPDISSGDGVVPRGNDPLPEPMLTKFYDAIQHHQGPLR